MRPGSESQALAVSARFLKEQTDAVYRLVRAYLKGIRSFERNFDEVVAIVAKRLQKPPELIRLAYPQVTINKPYVERASTIEALQIAIDQKKVRKEAVGEPATSWRTQSTSRSCGAEASLK